MGDFGGIHVSAAGAAAALRRPLTASVGSGGAVGESVANGTQTLSGTSSVTVLGGVAPYTYAWARTAGATQITALNNTSQTTGWQSDGTDVVRQATFKCTITDAATKSVEVTGFQIDVTHGTPP